MGRGTSKVSGGTKAKTYTLFHGSPNADITEFDIERAGSNTQSGEKFLFFTDSEEMADEFSFERLESSKSMFLNEKGRKGQVYKVEVTMKKPLDLTNPTKADIQNMLKLSDGELTPEMIKKFSKGNNQLFKMYLNMDEITKFGYDGFIAKMNANGQKEYAVLKSSQVKIKR